MQPTLHAIIPAGGAGTRLWPLSRQGRPKFLLDPAGRGRTLLQETFERLRPLSISITVVTGARHYEEVCRQLPQLSGGEDAFPGEVIVEPSPRDSMAAIGMAAYVVRERYGDSAVIGSFAADHVIDNLDAFADATQRAATGARGGWLTTIGVTPTEPSTAFGYIQPGPEELLDGVRRVERFIEKPEEDTAAEYLRQGFLWNAGIFVVQTGTLRSALAQQLPAMDVQLQALARRYMKELIATGETPRIDPAQWEKLTKIAIDYALAEPLAAQGQVAVVPAAPDLGWSDVGDFQAVARLRRGMGQGLLAIDSPGSLLLGEASASRDREGKTVAVLGIPGAVIVDTGDALLVTDLAHAQQVKQVVDQLRESGQIELL